MAGTCAGDDRGAVGRGGAGKGVGERNEKAVSEGICRALTEGHLATLGTTDTLYREVRSKPTDGVVTDSEI